MNGENYSPELQEEMRRVREKRDQAMSQQAAAGSTRIGIFEAGIRAALDHAVSRVDPDLSNLEGGSG